MIFPQIKVILINYICDSPKFIKYKKNHRKSRINKKWHKKYGAIYEECQGKAYEVFGEFYCCPHYKAKLEEAIKKQNENQKQ